MNLTMKLEERSFKNEHGQDTKYYVLSYGLADGSFIEISVKPDKARLILLSNKLLGK